MEIYLILLLLQYLVASKLSQMNRKYYQDPTNSKPACRKLNISNEDYERSLAYNIEKENFGRLNQLLSMLLLAGFLFFGGAGLFEKLSQNLAAAHGGGQIFTGLYFFMLLGFGSSLLQLPFTYYYTFNIEERYGFNKQTRKSFFVDRLKGLLLSTVLGGLLLSGLLSIIEFSGSLWWLWAWCMFMGFQLLAMWIFPTVLAPIFNKFTPLETGDLQEGIDKLADKVGFKTDGVFVMDASRRSSHGNAYFTGLFGKKRIVLFDTLLKILDVKEAVAVLAHELGHFKLNHIRWSLWRSLAFTGLMFYAMGEFAKYESFYHTFRLEGASAYGTLFVFSLWWSALSFFLTPIGSWFSRSNEFAADAFASKVADPLDLSRALLKLRSSSNSIPLSHPWFSAFYHSHPPLINRINRLERNE